MHFKIAGAKTDFLIVMLEQQCLGKNTIRAVFHTTPKNKYQVDEAPKHSETTQVLEENMAISLYLDIKKGFLTVTQKPDPIKD